MQKKIIIIGGSGFIGSSLCPHLSDAGYDVIVLSRNPRPVRLPSKNSIVAARWVHGDSESWLKGQRKSEVVEARWDEMDLKSGWWEIPKERVKNSSKQRVYLSPLSLSILQSQQALAGNSPWVFPSPIGEKPISGRALCKAVSRNINIIALPDFKPHDLRRTVASHMARLDVGRFYIERIVKEWR